jgi:hypothetical protein
VGDFADRSTRGGGMGSSFEIEDYGLAFDPERTS